MIAQHSYWVWNSQQSVLFQGSYATLKFVYGISCWFNPIDSKSFSVEISDLLNKTQDR